MENFWYAKNISEVLSELGSNKHGLSEKEAESRLEKFGPNKLPGAKADSLAVIFLRQFQSPLIYILFFASLIIFAMGETSDGIVIITVLIFNSIVGAFQEGKAQNTLLALAEFSETKGIVTRDGKELIIPDTELAPGDIIIIQEGQKIPADARIILSNNIKIDEAALTGESNPVHKIAEPLDKNKGIAIADQKNMAFKGTHVVAGNGKAIIVATGTKTEIGKISQEITTLYTEIPLKSNIRYLSHIIILAVLILITTLFIFGITAGRSVKEMFATVVSLAISMIPEGLPIVITLVLANGVWKMGKRHALVKKLQAVGSIGQVQIVAVDKTGTLTKNEMTVRKVYIDNKIFEINGVGYKAKGDIELSPDSSLEKNSYVISPGDFPEILLAGRVASLCSNAQVARYEETEHGSTATFAVDDIRWQVSGDPTEAALLVFSQKIGLQKDDLLSQHPLIEEVPFDFQTKYHAVTNMIGGQPFLSVVGAPESVLSICQTVWRRDTGGQLYSVGKANVLSARERKELESVFIQMSEQGLRVLAFAVKYPASGHLDKNMPLAIAEKNSRLSSRAANNISNLTFVGFFGIQDALRPEVKESVRNAASAGIKTVMITGDHKITAKAIAREAGIFRNHDEIITGEEIDSLSELELLRKLPKTSVFARVTPEHKLKIIQAYQKNGNIVAMTGDGVNDAPSLVAADIGVSMGKIGTEVAKEASDIVLLDDNFGSIVAAVEEGRSVFRTIKKVLLYLFSTNIGEMFTITGALFLGFPLPILPAQIIWLNLVTDGFLDVALAMEPKEKDLLNKNIEKPTKYLVDSLMLKRILTMALPMMIGTLILFKLYLPDDLIIKTGFQANMLKAWTMSLTCLAMFQWFNAWNCRSATASIFKTNPFSNKYLVGATIIVIFLQIFAVYNPVMQKILSTQPLSLFEWLIVIPIAFSVVIVEELRKLVRRWND